ncbi:MAG: type 4a pilus biogenesis protein PilO [Nitrospirae bacterium]|nr:type 4a pilus biogenesis protein PilO [Nitrospirota bacterium]
MGLELNINVETMTPVQKKLLLIIPPVLIIGLAVYLFMMPDYETMGKLGEELDNQTKVIDSLKKDTAKMGKIKSENTIISAKLAELKRKLPEEKEISGLLKQISELSIKEGMTIQSWKPKVRVVHPSNEVYEIPLVVQLSGYYHNAGMLFSKIAGLDRLVNVSNIGIEGSKVKDSKTLSLVNVEFIAATYSMIPEKEKKILKEKAKKEKEEKEKKDKEKK